MNLVNELIKHFRIEKDSSKWVPKTIGSLPQKVMGTQEGQLVFSIIRKLEHEGILWFFGNKGKPIIDNQYINYDLDQQVFDYGGYEFLINGFPRIREHFTTSVVPVVVLPKSGDWEIGTAFVIDSHLLVTARHCIENMDQILIRSNDGIAIEAEYILIPKDERIDLAFICAKDKPFRNYPKFQFQSGNVLDEVLTMGYPPIPGFDAIQTADVSMINTKASIGSITVNATDYRLGVEYFLINARVKGGNSGGPVINRYGCVVGMIVQVSNDGKSSEARELDALGYGVALPGQIITQIYNDRNKGSVSQMNFSELDEGFKTSI